MEIVDSTMDARVACDDAARELFRCPTRLLPIGLACIVVAESFTVLAREQAKRAHPSYKASAFDDCDASRGISGPTSFSSGMGQLDHDHDLQEPNSRI
jgi:hypothetical protein